MKSAVTESTFLAILLVLLCATIQPSTAATKQPSVETLFAGCEFDPAINYTTSGFVVDAFNPLSYEQWSYNFDVRKQNVHLVNVDKDKNLKAVDIYYKKNEAKLVCVDVGEKRVEKEISLNLLESLALPLTFPPLDSLPCGKVLDFDGDIYEYYSKMYDFLFSILKHNGSRKCTLFSMGLPGQKKDLAQCPNLRGEKKIWTFGKFPNKCENLKKDLL